MRFLPVPPAVLFTAVIFTAAAAFIPPAKAEPFAPKQLHVQFRSNPVVLSPGNDMVNIPITVTGGPSTVFLAVYTHGKAENIEQYWRQGEYGWRYTDQLDTCVYISPPFVFEDGDHVIPWDLSDRNGAILVPRAFGYPSIEIYYKVYLWAYDHEGQPAAPALPGGMVRLYEGGTDIVTLDDLSLVTASARWYLGNDPADTELIETTVIPLEGDWRLSGPPLFDVTDSTPYAYVAQYDSMAGMRQICRYEWAPNAVSARDPDWAVDLHWDTPGIDGGLAGALETESEYQFLFDFTRNGTDQGKMYILDTMSGEMLFDFTVPWLLPPGTTSTPICVNTAPPAVHSAGGFLHASSPGCWLQLFDPLRYIETEDDTELFRWVDAETEFINPSGAPAIGISSVAGFENLFQLATITGSASGTDLLVGPDGTSIAWLDLSGGGADKVAQSLVCNNGSVFDGIYTVQRDESGEMTGVRFHSTSTISKTIDFYIWYEYTDVNVVHPNGGEVLIAGMECTVDWAETYLRKTATNTPYIHMISLSTDAGRTWETIAEGHFWPGQPLTIPTAESDSCLVKVTNTELGIEDTSDCFFTITTETIVSDATYPAAFAVLPAAPNPFNPTTAIPVELPAPGHVRAVVYNLTGQQVAVLADGDFPAGRHTLSWRASGSAAGVYVCRVEYGGKTRAVKVTLAK